MFVLTSGFIKGYKRLHDCQARPLFIFHYIFSQWSLFFVMVGRGWNEKCVWGVCCGGGQFSVLWCLCLCCVDESSQLLVQREPLLQNMSRVYWFVWYMLKLRWLQRTRGHCSWQPTLESDNMPASRQNKFVSIFGVPLKAERHKENKWLFHISNDFWFHIHARRSFNNLLSAEIHTLDWHFITTTQWNENDWRAVAKVRILSFDWHGWRCINPPTW